MKIKIINPNTTQSMTDSVARLARRVARPNTQVWAVSPETGPDSIETFTDEYLAVPGVLKEVIRGDREENADAFIIACFGDPGLQAAREVTAKPVLGICESAITAAKSETGTGRPGPSGRAGRPGGRRRVHPAGVRWLCGLRGRAKQKIRRPCLGRGDARRQICRGHGGYAPDHQQGIHLGLPGK